MNVQKQSGSRDCGLFAIAMAQSLCNNEDPFDKTYMQSDLRGCLKDSMEAGVMKSFTAKQTRRKYRYHTVLHIDIYCKCRGIEEGLMIQCERCNRWYHKECCHADDSYFAVEDLKWTCNSCN